MGITVSRGKSQAIHKMDNNLKIEFSKLEISKEINFLLFREILFTTKDNTVFLTLGIESELFNDTKIMQVIYPFEKYNIKFINFGNILDIKKGFISMYDFINNKLNYKNYKFINQDSQTKHINIKPHSNNLFAIIPIQSKISNYNNLLYYHYKSIHGYFLQEKLLQKVHENLKFETQPFDISQYLIDKVTQNSNTEKLFKKISALISSDYENILKNSSIQLRDNDCFRSKLDELIIEKKRLC